MGKEGGGAGLQNARRGHVKFHPQGGREENVLAMLKQFWGSFYAVA